MLILIILFYYLNY